MKEDTLMTKKIIVEETGNPTPHRGWDYVAYYDGLEYEPGNQYPFGRGATPEDAKAELLESDIDESWWN